MADPITTIALAGFLLVANGSGNGAGGPLPLVEYMGEHAKANCTLAVAQEENMIDDDKLMQSLKSAKLHELAMTMKDGLNTVLGERGVRLSGGQRQRVCLARAFYHDREVLILDEATSALDDATQSEIVSEIQQLKGKKTMIVIAHRLSTVQDCDRIYRLDQGEIIEQGTPDEIIGHKAI